jgi:hypothetical protein
MASRSCGPTAPRYTISLLIDGTGGRIEAVLSGALLAIVAALTLAHL